MKRLDLDKIEQKINKDKPKESLKAITSNKFSDLFNNEKSQKFIIHLIYSFNIVQTEIAHVDNDQTKKCCICRKQTISAHKAIMGAIDGNLLKEMNNDITISSKKSNKIMCKQCFNDFAKWGISEYCFGNQFFSKMAKGF